MKSGKSSGCFFCSSVKLIYLLTIVLILTSRLLFTAMQGYGGNNSFAVPPLGSHIGDDPYLLANKLALERQRSLPNPYSLWSGRDSASVAAKTDVMNETSLAQQRQMLLSSITENARTQHHSQNVESVSVLQGLSDRSASTLNSGTSGWLNFPIQGGLNPLQNKLDIHQSQNFPPQSAFGVNQQRLPPQNIPLTNLLAQSMDNQSQMLTPEMLLASGIPQDPQLLTLLQRQYLLQLQSQPPVASQNVSLLDMLLLKQQQQKQEEQQQQLMLQQQQLLSQVHPEHNLNQRLGEGSLAQLQTGGFAAGNANVDHSPFRQAHDLQAPNMQEQNAGVSDYVLPSSESQGVGTNIGPEISTHLPHQIFANNVKQRGWDASLPEQIVEQQKSSYSITDGMDSALMSETANKYVTELKSNYDKSVKVSSAEIAPSFPSSEHLDSVALQQHTVGHDDELFVNKTVEGLTESLVKASEERRDVEQYTDDSSSIKDMKNPEVREVKKSSEKKSKKQKSSKVSTDSVRSVSKSQQAKSSESEGPNSGNAKSQTQVVQGDALAASGTGKEKRKTEKVAHDVDLQLDRNTLSAVNYADDSLPIETKGQPEQASYASQMNIQAHAVQRAWKPAPGFKPKSLLEIQQEEQRRAREEMAVSEISTSLNTMSVSTPWAGVVNADHKASSEIRQDAGSTELKVAKADSSSTLKSKNSLREDLFWDNTVDKLGGREMEISDSAPAEPLTSILSSQFDSVVDDDFIDAKDTKKSRKKSSKAKAGAKAAPVASVDVFVGSSPADKGKHARQVQQQKEVLPAVPSGPSFGDFVPWKEEAASAPAPAWSTDSGKSHRPASLRDILKEQEKKVSSPLPVPTPQKRTTNQPARGSGPSWTSTSPAKAASPITVISQAASHLKSNVEDDLFWGPLEQPKPEAKQYDSINIHSHLLYQIRYTPDACTNLLVSCFIFGSTFSKSNVYICLVAYYGFCTYVYVWSLLF